MGLWISLENFIPTFNEVESSLNIYIIEYHLICFISETSQVQLDTTRDLIQIVYFTAEILPILLLKYPKYFSEIHRYETDMAVIASLNI